MAKSAIMSLRIVSDAKNAVSGLGKASSAVGKFAKATGAAAIAAGGAALVSYGVAAVKMAGDLEQSVGAIDTVFKGSAKEMHKFASSASTDVGLTKNEYYDLGTMIGTQLKNGGTAMDQLAPKTNQLIGLGADLSSMFGGTSKDAVDALSSALKGERDPIEKYGVSLKQSTIDAEAAALGFKKVGGSLSEEANQAATLSLIMKQTADAHGNFAKEANTLQGQQQRMSAGWKDIQTTLGGLLLPVMTALFSFINTNVLPGLKAFTDQLAEGGLGGAFGALAPVIAAAMQVLSPMSLIWQALLPLLPQITAMFQTLAAAVIPALTQVFGAIIPVITQVIAAVAPLIASLLSGLIPVILTLVTAVLPPVISAFAGIVAAILPVVSTIVSLLVPVITQVIAAVVPLIASLVSGLIPVILTLVTAVLPPVISAFAGIVAAILPVVSTIVSLLVPVLTSLMSVAQTVFTIIMNVVQTSMNTVQNIITVVMAVLRGDWAAAWQGIKQTFSDILSGIVTHAQLVFSELPGKILSALGNVGDLLVGAGKAIIDGFLGGLRSAWDAGKNFISGIGDWIADHKGPISYDRKLLKPAGKAIMGGLTKSLKAAMPELASTVGEATQTINGLNASPTVDLRTRKPKPGTSNRGAGGGVTNVYNINVSGVVGDKVGLARQIKKLLSDEEKLVGGRG